MYFLLNIQSEPLTSHPVIDINWNIQTLSAAPSQRDDEYENSIINHWLLAGLISICFYESLQACQIYLVIAKLALREREREREFDCLRVGRTWRVEGDRVLTDSWHRLLGWSLAAKSFRWWLRWWCWWCWASSLLFMVLTLLFLQRNVCIGVSWSQTLWLLISKTLMLTGTLTANTPQISDQGGRACLPLTWFLSLHVYHVTPHPSYCRNWDVNKFNSRVSQLTFYRHFQIVQLMISATAYSHSPSVSFWKKIIFSQIFRFIKNILISFS